MKRISNKFRNDLLRRTIFIGGPEVRSSVKIRCIQIANHLGCDCIYNNIDINHIPNHKNVFICVKAKLSDDDLSYLTNKGIVIWDIHDTIPPLQFIDYYLTSSIGAYNEFFDIKTTFIIPHHHCNINGLTNPIDMIRRPSWIGRPYWCPDFGLLDYDFYNTNYMSHYEIIDAYKKTGIGLNFRAKRSESDFHIKINPGVKLLNSIGFGIPSISEKEPSYINFGEDCTIFADINECQDIVEKLKNDDNLYRKIHINCLKLAPEYHISKIAPMYLNLLFEIT
jgi:hypothetical protein